MKICPVGAELFSMRTGGPTDVTKLAVAFRSFAKGLTNKVVIFKVI